MRHSYHMSMPIIIVSLFSTVLVEKRWLVVGTDGGLYTSPDNGITWNDSLNTGLATQYGAHYNPEVLMVGFQDLGSRLHSGPNSTSWNDITLRWLWVWFFSG